MDVCIRGATRYIFKQKGHAAMIWTCKDAEVGWKSKWDLWMQDVKSVGVKDGNADKRGKCQQMLGCGESCSEGPKRDRINSNNYI